MLTLMNVNAWTPHRVNEWLLGLFDDSEWLDTEIILKNNIGGKELLLMTAQDLKELGVTKVDRQEVVLEAIEDLRFHNYSIKEMTLQTYILRVACQSNSLRARLESKQSPPSSGENKSSQTVSKVDLSNGSSSVSKQIVSLDTLTAVSNIVGTVKQIADVIGRPPFTRHGDYRSMRSLLLALSIELTSTAQRDQFVERPNDIIRKSCRTLADYCDRIVEGTRDPLLIQPFQLETVRIRKQPTETNLGLVVYSKTNNNAHVIQAILPLSPAKKTNKLDEGDEIIQFNQYIVGWSPKNVQKLLASSSKRDDIILMVKKRPND